jgi:hypothetical protein
MPREETLLLVESVRTSSQSRTALTVSRQAPAAVARMDDVGQVRFGHSSGSALAARPGDAALAFRFHRRQLIKVAVRKARGPGAGSGGLESRSGWSLQMSLAGLM